MNVRNTLQKSIHPCNETITEDDIKTARIIKLFGEVCEKKEESCEVTNEFLNEIIDLSFTQPSASSLAIKLLKSI